MFDHTHYVPILRWKMGEKRAVKSLLQAEKARITPLLEWSRPGEVAPEEDREVPTPTPRALAKDILKHWGSRPFFYDPYWFWAGNLDGDTTKLARYAAELANGGPRPIPVLRLNDGSAYRSALSPLTSGRGVCIRLPYADLIEGNLHNRMMVFFANTECTPSIVHVVADFEAHYREVDIAALCAQLPHIGQYRTFTVASGSFPIDLREFKGPQVFYLPREEWLGWHAQVDKPLPRRPTFADYATLHPVLTSAKKGLNPSATIRYTTDDHWLVMKGEGLYNEDGPGHEQYVANATLLTQRRDYRGPDFSAGDRYIRDVATAAAGTGSPTTWVQAGVNHHLTFVARQVDELINGTSRHEAPAESAPSVTPHRASVRKGGSTPLHRDRDTERR